jgi:hypothetical protein
VVAVSGGEILVHVAAEAAGAVTAATSTITSGSPHAPIVTRSRSKLKGQIRTMAAMRATVATIRAV